MADPSSSPHRQPRETAATGSPPAQTFSTIDPSQTAASGTGRTEATRVATAKRHTQPADSGAPAHDAANESTAQPSPRKKRSGAIRVLPPTVVPISDEDYEQAVTALATLIGQWWARNHEQK